MVKGFVVQGGDFVFGNGLGGWSIYGPTFDDEAFDVPLQPGTLAMANRGRNSNGSQRAQSWPWGRGRHDLLLCAQRPVPRA